MWRTIRTRLTISYLGLAIIPLLIFGLTVAWVDFQTQRSQALVIQEEVAGRVAAQVERFIRGIERDLLAVTRVQGLEQADQERQRLILTELLLFEDVFEELFLLDATGQEQIHVSRLQITADESLTNRAQQNEFIIPTTQKEVYYSSVRFSEREGEPFVTIAVPLIDRRQDEVTSVLVAEVRFRTVWNLIRQLEIREGERVFVTDLENQVVAARVPSVVLQGTLFDTPAATGFFPGLEGDAAVIGIAEVTLNNQSLIIVAEQLEAVALRQARLILWSVLGSVALLLLIAGFLAFINVSAIVRPIQSLAEAAQAIRSGDLSPRVAVTNSNELGTLAQAFNEMAGQLQDLIGSLEMRVQARTRGLEIVANLGEQLSAVLELETLMKLVVDQVQEKFDYYHAHIYLLDDEQKHLVVAEGTGPAGAAMKAAGHIILLAAPTSLVARAARNRQIVRVDNVREASDWLSNPLLPDTYAEMAVPIILADQVVGVLDVQEDEVGGLDEADESLLRSLANQVAVAIRNARLFDEVEHRLAEAHEAQKRYIEQSWSEAVVADQYNEHDFYHPALTPLSDEILTEAEQEALKRQQPTVVRLKENGLKDSSNGPHQTSLVAPVKLGEQVIGAFQLHQVDESGQVEQAWSEQDLSLVQSVLDQVALSAENLRLFDETRERAAREQTIREITDKLRASPNLDALLETAARELGERLGVRHTVLELGIRSEQALGDEQSPALNGNE